MATLWLDFETRSRCDLKRKGVYNYAHDMSTEVLCMSYAFDDEEVQTWVQGQDFPDRVDEHVYDKQQVRAHNAAFERLIWHSSLYRLTATYPLNEQFYCTAAQARANCLPGSLEDLGRGLGASMRKDYRGAQLIRALSIPRPDGTFNEDPTLMAEMIAYCEQDVRTMRHLSKMMRELTPTELADYHANERINDRGVMVDQELAQAAIRYAEAETKEIEQIVREVTNGEVLSVRSSKMRNWVWERLGPAAQELMVVHKDGEAKRSIDKIVRANLLALADEDPKEVPEDVAEVIQCADDIWASSVAKFTRLNDLAEVDGRVRGAFVFNGGAATGRASSYGAQVHNFTRKCLKNSPEAREAMVKGKPLVPTYGKRVTDVLKGMLRPALIPAPGNVLVVGDWSAIEARCNPWLSASPLAEPLLDAFRQDKDVYIREAAAIFGVEDGEVTPEQRQIGKVAILSCGFGGGENAFAKMGRAYGLPTDLGLARRIVQRWRTTNRWAPTYWNQLERAYTRAMLQPGKEFKAGRVAYLFDMRHLWYVLPSGRVLGYPFAKLEDEGVSYLKAAWKPAAGATEWPRARLWRGLACENITQAVANDLLRAALLELQGYSLGHVVLHVHDEIVLEVKEKDAESAKNCLGVVMRAPLAWTTGLPLAVDVKIMDRYGK